MKSFLREPLVLFLVLGGLLFLFSTWRGGGSGPGSSRIAITPGLIQHLASGFTRTWQRPPTEAELKSLIDEHVKEEIAVREATAMGLDRDDAVIRRRLRQKIEFLTEDILAQAPPTDAQIREWVEGHPEMYRGEAEISFRQVFVSTHRRESNPRADAEELLARLEEGVAQDASEELGDPTMLPAEVPLCPRREVARIFGDDFAERVFAIEPGRWTGPIESPYGLHLVRVFERRDALAPDFAAVRALAERDLSAARRKKELDALYQRLLRDYTVVVDWPAPADSGTSGGGEQVR